MEVPAPYFDAIDEIIDIMDAYAMDPNYVRSIVRLAAIIDTEHISDYSWEVLMEHYSETHKVDLAGGV